MIDSGFYRIFFLIYLWIAWFYYFL